MILFDTDIGELEEPAPRPPDAQARIDIYIRDALILFEEENQGQLFMDFEAP